MSCVLRVRGADFAVDRFLAESPLKPVAVFRKGQPQWPTANPGGPKLNGSGFHVVTSEAEFSMLPAQVTDAIRFLQRNRSELSRLNAFPGVERISLDFGIEERDIAAQSESFPPELLRLIGDLGIWLEFTLYPVHEGVASEQNPGKR